MGLIRPSAVWLALSPGLVAGFACSGGVVEHSNVTAPHACSGPAGTECPYECTPGFVAIGRHVCQSYTTRKGDNVVPPSFFGGRCQRLCEGQPSTCSFDGSLIPVRTNTSQGCFDTRCLAPAEALQRLGRGAYAVWRKGRLASTGIYSGSVDPTQPGDASEAGHVQSDQAHIGINGVALIFECVAAEMGWITRAEAAQRVNLTLTALAGELPGFNLARQAADGWIPTFFNRSTGAALGHGQPYTALDSGLNSAGVLFARTYFSKAPSTPSHPNGVAPGLLASIARPAKK
eukprot:gene5245-5301_t